MTPFCALSFLFLSHLLQLVSAVKCPSSFSCGTISNIRFPFTIAEHPDCGVLSISGCNHPDSAASKSVLLQTEGQSLDVLGVYHSTIAVRDNNLHEYLKSQNCDAFNNNITLPPPSPLYTSEIKDSITLFRCNKTFDINPPKAFQNFPYCNDYNIFYYCPNNGSCPGVDSSSLAACSTIQLPTRDPADTNLPFTFLTSEFFIEVHLSPDCAKCFHQERGQCQLDINGNFYCSKDAAEDKSWVWKLSLGIGLPAGIVIGLLIAWLYKRTCALSMARFRKRHIASHSNPDPEVYNVSFGVPIFSYKQLREATNNFDDNRKLGDGGYGTVYHAKLQDGREVAIKRLYDHNYKRVQQFMNEVEILTRLRHKNLVSLYGCTSYQSHELLLVYEYIANSTVASHLYGHVANLGLLSWPIRMKIAIETAGALAYLHASNIIHRDVKTNNILLESDYCVKVADFGLSRLFPNNVTHVSTAPQGTLGYIDPEYHQCYQLTSKSDVYSFGVVLVELISSLPPINMTRHKDEINLANLAMKKIRRGVIDELVDPSLGFYSNNEVKRTITSVAELAFRCLQCESQLRPSMDEVLEVLIRIESGKDELEEVTQKYVNIKANLNLLRDRDEVKLLKGAKLMPSLTTMIENWESECTTPNISSN